MNQGENSLLSIKKKKQEKYSNEWKYETICVSNDNANLGFVVNNTVCPRPPLKECALVFAQKKGNKFILYS